MKKILDSRFVRDMAVYVGFGTPYYFLLKTLGVDFSGLKGSVLIIGFYICIDIARWGLKRKDNDK